MIKSLLLKSITFLSAFLLFQLELIVGKIFLHNFGGSYVVWGACVVFFQAMLLLGYQYSQVILEKLSIARYRYFHIILSLLPVLSFPGKSLPIEYPVHPVPLVLDIFGHLSWTIGLVFFVLSTTSIIYQVWLSKSTLPDRNNPYFLFATSNLGSFAALLSYPFFFELQFDLNQQQNIWRVGYAIFILLQILILVFVGVQKEKRPQMREAKNISNPFLWPVLLYSAAGVMIFLAVTNIITLEISPMPLLWVIPLSIYLLSFVLVFKKKSFCPSWIGSHSHLVLAAGIIVYFLIAGRQLSAFLQLVILFCLTFVLCLLAQSKIYSHKPSDHEALPRYYFFMSIGGFLGGLITSWVAPLISNDLLEYFLGLLAICLASREQGKKRRLIEVFLLVMGMLVLLFAAPYIMRANNLLGLTVTLVGFYFIFSKLNRIQFGVLVSLIAIMGCINILSPLWAREQYTYLRRNYYGIYKVQENRGLRYFLHGEIIHGAQYLDPSRQSMPLTYFAIQSPLGRLLTTDLFDFKRAGILGLGAGTLSTYFAGEQTVDYFELDPEVLKIAREYFTFLKHARGNVRHYLGDARLSLSKVEENSYDILIGDAFSGDSIPVHLLTREAILNYRRHLRDRGIIVFNISNRYLDVGFPLFSTAFSVGAKGCYLNGDVTYPNTFKSTWVAITWSEESFQKLVNDLHWIPADESIAKQYRPWTDRYSTLLPYIKYSEFRFDLIRNFKAWLK